MSKERQSQAKKDLDKAINTPIGSALVPTRDQRALLFEALSHQQNADTPEQRKARRDLRGRLFSLDPDAPLPDALIDELQPYASRYAAHLATTASEGRKLAAWLTVAARLARIGVVFP